MNEIDNKDPQFFDLKNPEGKTSTNDPQDYILDLIEVRNMRPNYVAYRTHVQKNKAQKEILEIDPHAFTSSSSKGKSDVKISFEKTKRKSKQPKRFTGLHSTLEKAAKIGATILVAGMLVFTAYNALTNHPSNSEPQPNPHPITGTQTPVQVAETQSEIASYPFVIDDSHAQALRNDNPRILLSCYKENFSYAYKQKTGIDLGSFYIRPKPTEVSTSSNGENYHTKYDNEKYRSDEYVVSRYDGYQIYRGLPPTGDQPDDPNNMLCEVIFDAKGEPIHFEDANPNMDPVAERILAGTHNSLDEAVSFIDQSEAPFYDDQPNLLQQLIDNFNSTSTQEFGSLTFPSPITTPDNEHTFIDL